MSTDDPGPKDQAYSSTYQAKLAVHERDRYRCLNCLEMFNEANRLDIDHIVNRGKGGADAFSSKVSLCRRCHKAKHDERDHAPTVRFVSANDMIEKDFSWFCHLWTKQLPALTEVVSHRITPKFSLVEGGEAWHIPLGDLRRLDAALAKHDGVRYERKEGDYEVNW